MSTNVTIVKEASGHNLRVAVMNPGAAQPTVHILGDNQAVRVLIHGDGDIDIGEVEKDAPAA